MSLQSAYTQDLIEAGLDEAGRGCLAGPVVAAAVILPKDYKHTSLNDSKQLTRSEREKLREEIQKDAIAFAVAEASNSEIDQVNILNASFLAMHRAVDNLLVIPQMLLIDGNRFKPYPFIAHTCIVKGDTKFLSIAAASILAKTYRDDQMEKLAKDFPHYGWETNAAYPTKAHYQALEKYGITPHHRRTFRLGEIIK
ncbi:ribonuclease HII [Xanthocytophaga flava]|uniref:ribonuclease HII n=1 Tax=Xanthocytophaga flava TaxID=3048013 RepID=UPI0028D4FE27|nr:ribonuclease HII [Xanthocytophaga flavus]MDJ1470073.1 ribonuclease HII [Xanthocytophaga flavus]